MPGGWTRAVGGPSSWSRGRVLLIAYLSCAPVVMLLIGAVTALRPEWIENTIGYWDDRWGRRLEHGESLTSSGRYEEAVAYLQHLDPIFPAQSVKHKRDRERERLLAALGRSQMEIGRSRAGLETYRRLAAFDPRNYQNHFLLASACSQDNKSGEAIQHFEAALAIHPSHQRSVEAVVAIHYARGAFAEAVSALEQYVDATLFCELTLEADEDSFAVVAAVDGEFHELEFVLPLRQEWSGRLQLRGIDHPIEWAESTVLVPLRMGQSPDPDRAITIGAGAWTAQGMRQLEPGQFLPVEQGCSLQMETDVKFEATSLIKIRIRLFKKINRSCWAQIEKSYRNILEPDRLANIRGRLAVID